MSISIFSPSRSIFVLILLCAAINIVAPAQTFTVLATLDYATDAQYPSSPLIQGLDGNLYGTAEFGGAYGAGTFFQVTPSGTLTILYNFCFNDNNGCPDGAGPTGPVVLGVDGNFYGATQGSGPLQDGGYGTIYKMTSAGSLTTLYEFNESCTTDCSANPISGLTLARNGAFYGISASPSHPATTDGLIFKFSSSGTFTPLLVVCPDLTCLPTPARLALYVRTP